MSKLNDGFKTTVAFPAVSSGVTLQFFEKEATPPGVTGGGEIDVTTMRNAAFRTKFPKSLKNSEPASFVGAYDPIALTEFLLMINVNQLIVITFPDDSNWTFWGWIDEFAPNTLVEGDQPTANVTVIVSNLDNAGVEVPPVFSS